MEDGKIENKVVLKLEEYDRLKNLEYLNNTIVDYVLTHTSLEDGKMSIEYDIRYSKFLTEIVKEKYPDKFNKRFEELKKEDKE